MFVLVLFFVGKQRDYVIFDRWETRKTKNTCLIFCAICISGFLIQFYFIRNVWLKVLQVFSSVFIRNCYEAQPLQNLLP